MIARNFLLLFAQGLALACSSALAADAAKASPRALAHPVQSVAPCLGVTLAPGDTWTDVQSLLGTPARKLSPDVWLYTGFNGGREQAENDDCSTLMITFSKGRIVDLKLINERAEILYAARMPQPAEKKRQLAGK